MAKISLSNCLGLCLRPPPFRMELATLSVADQLRSKHCIDEDDENVLQTEKKVGS